MNGTGNGCLILSYDGAGCCQSPKLQKRPNSQVLRGA